MEPVHYYFDESGEKGFLDSNFSAKDIGLWQFYQSSIDCGSKIDV